MAAKEIIPGCAVCQKPYVYDTEGPFLFPCLHSVCENCLKSENDKTLLCSSCQETFPKSTFPIDYVTRKKTLLSTIVHNGNELLCTNREDGNQAMSWCQECEAFLCEHCHVAHGDMKATRKHKVILVQDLTNFPQTLKCMSYCDQHAQHPVTLYDSSCNAPLCAMCVLAEHKSCKTEDLDAAWETRRTFLEDKGVALRARLDMMKECRSLQEDIGERLKPQQDAVEEVIRCTFQKLHLMLDQREIELQTEMDESTKFLTQRSDHQLVTLESEVDKLTMNLEFIQKSTLFPNPVEHFAMKDIIDKRIMVAAESEIPRVNGQEYSITFSRDGLRGLQQQISSFGGLLTNRIRSGKPLCFI
ncbi:E3 ubiquitin-protein ligase TRIM33-like [Haliotis rubra]|uniref:E3 ubiquitin-protein ligase TRIM33-like n=1 Tax=Haliotis rubra TaxID=36100 RepID=UPI001EE5FA2C|nr:E3 ubiquitin-protein ligase TRIM33-like [Haliotis rubra]XP_046559575.1 E3 ubiquitin-protein ligase TRIM33-like [Haliotis rubra]